MYYMKYIGYMNNYIEKKYLNSENGSTVIYCIALGTISCYN